MPRFNGICLVTPDVIRLRDFYRTVLDVEGEGTESFVQLKTSGAVISIFCESGMERMAPGSMRNHGHGGYTIEFEVEDVDAEYERLMDLRVPIVKMPSTQTWGRRSVWFRDPAGNIINFYSNVANDNVTTD